jgi:uncharacterized protein YbbC (DUF1343 family)
MIARRLKITLCMLVFMAIQLLGQPSPKIVYSGLDNLIRQNFEPVRGKKGALFCNHSSRTLGGEHILDVAESSALEFAQLFILRDAAYDSLWPAPELLERYTSENYHAIALKKPYLRPYQFRGADYILLDMQINGTADDPVLSLLRILMLIAHRLNIPLIILDRPNYFSVMAMPGPVHSDLKLPFFHGLSLGEAARFFNKKDKLLRSDLLQIIPLLNYSANMAVESYPHLVQPASPLMKKAGHPKNYPAVRLAGLTNLQTVYHEEFQQLLIYADWLDARRLHRDLIQETGSDFTLELLTLRIGPVNEFSAFSIENERAVEAIFALFRAAAVMFPNEFFLSPRRCTESFGNDLLNRLIVLEKKPLRHLLYYWEPELREFQSFASQGVYLYR